MIGPMSRHLIQGRPESFSRICWSSGKIFFSFLRWKAVRMSPQNGWQSHPPLDAWPRFPFTEGLAPTVGSVVGTRLWMSAFRNCLSYSKSPCSRSLPSLGSLPPKTEWPRSQAISIWCGTILTGHSNSTVAYEVSWGWHWVHTTAWFFPLPNPVSCFSLPYVLIPTYTLINILSIKLHIRVFSPACITRDIEERMKSTHKENLN